MLTAGIVSFRLGGPDGVSIEAAKWASALNRIGWKTITVAGAGTADRLVPGLGLEDTDQGGPDVAQLTESLEDADVVVVENLCSLPLNPAAAGRVAAAVKGRPAVLHHHDLPWQRQRFAGSPYVIPDDPSWGHVTINELSRLDLADRGIRATTIRNAFDVDAPQGDRRATRNALGIGPSDRLVLQPTRAIRRKNIPAAVALAQAVDAVFWLIGPAEEGYDGELARLLAEPRRRGMRVIHGLEAPSVADAYAAADLVTLPSFWEGFGNPVVESAIHRRPLAIGDYPVSRELSRYGFRWLSADDHDAARRWFADPDEVLLEHNWEVAHRWFSFDALDAALAELLAELLR
ncbi:MAG TPA: glycosyltransferase [Acidimicrobiales bacterium]|nr:glycosyltransferase [Acidimicrobiales bacterium]